MKCIVVGAGWSGLAAAVQLTADGHQVALFEAAAQAGGRARDVQWQDLTVDNGQHLMIGAYQAMLALLEQLGLAETDMFQRQPLAIPIYSNRYPTLQLSLQSRLPWPLSLLSNLQQSCGFAGLWHLLRLASRRPGQQTVAQWCRSAAQPQRLIDQLWEPLCLAMLNTPIAEASAHVFATVLKHSLATGPRAADLLIPKVSLGQLLPAAALRYLASRQQQVRLNTRVSQLLIDNQTITGIQAADGQVYPADQVILATAAPQALRLLPETLQFAAPQHYPICTVYLQYPATCRLQQTIIGSTGSLSQWLFDRSQQRPGLIAVVISGPGRHQQMDKNTLVNAISAELHKLQPQLPAAPTDSFVIREKQATFACTPDWQQQRPGMRTAVAGLWLAADYIAHDYPATLESAIINGQRCAKAITLSEF